LGDSRAVDGDEGLAAPIARLMDGPSEAAFAAPGLTDEQDRNVLVQYPFGPPNAVGNARIAEIEVIQQRRRGARAGTDRRRAGARRRLRRLLHQREEAPTVAELANRQGMQRVGPGAL